MSATTTRLPRAQAVELAWELLSLLSPYCERIEILGSIRRGRPDCGDIELLAIPKLEPAVGLDLFGNPLSNEPLNRLHMRLDWMLADGVLHGRQPKRWGNRYRAAIYSGFPVDLFICLPPAQFGVLKVIRTGSNEFSKRLVTPLEKGGWMPQGMYCAAGVIWRDGIGIETPEEEQVFEAIGRPWVAPEDREI